jgi:hypothetical protein
LNALKSYILILSVNVAIINVYKCGFDIEKCIDDLNGFKIASLDALLCGKLPCQGNVSFILAFICFSSGNVVKD